MRVYVLEIYQMNQKKKSFPHSFFSANPPHFTFLEKVLLYYLQAD